MLGQNLLKLLSWLTKISAISGITLLSYAIFSYIFESRHDTLFGLAPLVNKLEYSEYEKTDPTVRISVNGAFTCTGFVVSQIYIITAAHCVEELHQVVQIHDSSKEIFILGEVVGIYDPMDQALIRASIGSRIAPVKADFTGKLMSMETTQVITCGFPGGQPEVLCNAGTLSGSRFFMRTGVGALYKGMSGGPVFVLDEKEGLVVTAINSAVDSNGIIVGPLISFSHNMEVPIEQ